MPKHDDVRPFERLRMAQLPRQQAADAAQLALFGIQDLSPEEMMLGVSTLFAALCRRCAVDPHDMHTMGLKVLAPEPYHRRANQSLETLRDFAGLRIMGQDVVTH